MSRSEIIKFLILRSIGNFLFLFAIYGIVMTLGPALFFEVQYRIMQARGVEFAVAEPQTSGFGELLAGQRGGQPTTVSEFGKILTGEKKQILIPIDTQFSIVIPRIGANARVIPNVDAGNKEEFLKELQKGVAHAKGTVFPGLPGNIYLFAHSTDNFWNVGRYNAIFYLLKELVPGDDVIVFFENTRYNYRVVGSQIMEPHDVSLLTKSQEGSEQTLILQTCWPPGTTWKRLIVFARPKGL